MQPIPQALSLMQAAAISGDEPTIEFVAQAYTLRHPQCLRWQTHVGDGLWHTYPNFVQQQIAQGLRHGASHVTVQMDQEPTFLDLVELQQRRAGEEAQALRCHMQTMIQYRIGDGGWAVTTVLDEVAEWDQAFVSVAAGPIATAVWDPVTLSLLVRKRIVDPSLWMPACKNPECRGMTLPESVDEQWFGDALDEFLAPAFGVPDGVSRDIGALGRQRVAERATGPDRALPGRYEAVQSRFADGLAAPTSGSPGSAFYDAGYRSDVGTLPFAMALPQTAAPLGFAFTDGPLVEMCGESVMKVYELRRQRVTLSPLHIVPIHVYTYELDGEADQIYSAMNRAMRTQDPEAIAFWRPLIAQVLCCVLLKVRALMIHSVVHGMLTPAPHPRTHRDEVTCSTMRYYCGCESDSGG